MIEEITQVKARFKPGYVAKVACLLVLSSLAFSVAGLRADTTENSFETANKLYEQGKFADAAAAYTGLIQSGNSSATLYFNLGNSYFKSGQIGRAIAAYCQAELDTPRDPDIRANLQFARNQVQAPSRLPSWRQRWIGKLSLTEWTVLASAASWLCLLLLALGQLRPALKAGLRTYALTAGACAGLLWAGTATAWRQTRFGHRAIVIVRDANVHQGPLEESPNTFTVHDGAELLVLDTKGDWLQVTVTPGRIGWLQRDRVLQN